MSLMLILDATYSERKFTNDASTYSRSSYNCRTYPYTT